MNQIVQVRQISQYPDKDPVFPDDRVVIQEGGLGGPYRSATLANLVSTALMLPDESLQYKELILAPGHGLLWEGFDGAYLRFGAVGDDRFFFGTAVQVPSLASLDNITIGGRMVATIDDVNALSCQTVHSVNGRTGAVLIEEADVRRAGGAPIRNAHFGGWITAPSAWDTRTNDDTVATTNWVHRAICETGVASFNGRSGNVVLTVDDVNSAYANAPPGVYPTAPSPVLGDASDRIATTLFVDDSMADLEATLKAIIISQIPPQLVGYAPLASPAFTGIPTAPTANPGTTTGQLATCAYVQAAVTASTSGVASFNTRTGAVVLTTADVTAAGGAALVSPAFTGAPTAPTATPGTNSAQLATTAFVQAAITGSSVASFNGRTGVVTLVAGDVTGTGVFTNTVLAGTPVAPTAAPGTNTTQLATTAFVAAALVAAGGVTSFNSRTGAITLLAADVSAAGGALIASPTFTGTPAAPTAVAGTNTTQIATTAFVAAALVASSVTSFNGRGGAVVLTLADITGAGGAPLASPTFTGTPAAPTALPGNNTTQLATTAFVAAAVAAGVTSFNSRTGAVTLSLADVTGVGGAQIASPTFTGVPAAPTAAVGTSSTQLATTAFVTGQASTTMPLASGAAAIGTSTSFARADHVHPLTANIAFTYSGKPLASGKIIIPMVFPVTLPANLTGSVTTCGTVPGASAVFTLTRLIAAGGTAAIGTVTVATSGVATYATSATTLAAGDAVQIVAPATQDANLSDIGIALLATRA